MDALSKVSIFWALFLQCLYLHIVLDRILIQSCAFLTSKPLNEASPSSRGLEDGAGNTLISVHCYTLSTELGAFTVRISTNLWKVSGVPKEQLMLWYPFSDKERFILDKEQGYLQFKNEGQEKQVCLATGMSKICSSDTLLMLEILKHTAVEEIMRSYAFGD